MYIFQVEEDKLSWNDRKEKRT